MELSRSQWKSEKNPRRNFKMHLSAHLYLILSQFLWLNLVRYEKKKTDKLRLIKEVKNNWIQGVSYWFANLCNDVGFGSF